MRKGKENIVDHNNFRIISYYANIVVIDNTVSTFPQNITIVLSPITFHAFMFHINLPARHNFGVTCK